MSDYITFFTIILLASVLYVFCYREYVFKPKVKKLGIANDFRYARNLNIELIALLHAEQANLDKTVMFSGFTYDTLVIKMQIWHDKVYIDATFKTLISKGKKANKKVINDLQIALQQQIHFQNEVKTIFNRMILKRQNQRLPAA